MKTVKLLVKVKVPFKGSKKTLRKGIKKWAKEALASDRSYIPLYVDSDEQGYIEDCENKINVEVKEYEKNYQWRADWWGRRRAASS